MADGDFRVGTVDVTPADVEERMQWAALEAGVQGVELAAGV